MRMRAQIEIWPGRKCRDGCCYSRRLNAIPYGKSLGPGKCTIIVLVAAACSSISRVAKDIGTFSDGRHYDLW